MNEWIYLKESAFNEIPNKNESCIKTLFGELDSNTIVQCVKALILNYELIIVGKQNKIMFEVIEGLKQLMFPFVVEGENGCE